MNHASNARHELGLRSSALRSGKMSLLWVADQKELAALGALRRIH